MRDMTIRPPAGGTLYVAKPSVPPLDEFRASLEEIWAVQVLTNNGSMAQRFERALAEHLGVEHISLVANATVGAVVALQQLKVSGEVITTPFSFVATANAIRYAGAEPVFVDIDPVTLNIDPERIERSISPRTSAIYAVHCYGVPCDVHALEEIGRRHGLPVVYDAAHAFGVRIGDESLLRHGALSVLSFHATKVFHSAEGGAVVCPDRETKLAIDRLCNHGITDEITVDVTGLNAKMSEIHAALGLAQLKRFDADVETRRQIGQRYEDAFRSVRGLRCLCQSASPGHNQYAFPIMVEREFPLSRDELHKFLKERNIVARRYFYPLIPHLGAYRIQAKARGDMFPIAEDAAERVLCLPMYPDLVVEDQMRVIESIMMAHASAPRRRAS